MSRNAHERKVTGKRMGRHSSKSKGKQRDRKRSLDEQLQSSEEFSSESDGSIKEPRKKKSKHSHHRSKHHKHHHSKKNNDLKKVKEKISAEDYFRKSAEYRKWLSEKDITFGDLSSEESRKYFLKFVKKWNNGRLSKSYYSGLETAEIPHSSQTKHKWKLHDVNEDELYRVAHDVGQETHQEHHVFQHQHHDKEASVIGPMLPPSTTGTVEDCPSDEEEALAQEKSRLRVERKRFQRDQNLVLDELLPKATGRDAKIEKKKMLAEKRAEREGSPEMKESYLMGQSHHGSIRQRIVAIREQRDKKNKAAKEKLMDYHAKEAAKAQAILELARANRKEGALWK